MSGIGVVELLVLFVVLPLVALVVAAYLLGTARRAAVMDEQLARARRHQVGVSVLAGAVAMVAMPAGRRADSVARPGGGAARAAVADGRGRLPGAVGRRGDLPAALGRGALDRAQRALARQRGAAGWLRACIGLGVLDLVLFARGVDRRRRPVSRWTEGDRARTATPLPRDRLRGSSAHRPRSSPAPSRGWSAEPRSRGPTIATDLRGRRGAAPGERRPGAAVARLGTRGDRGRQPPRGRQRLELSGGPDPSGPVGAAFSGLGVLAVIAAIAIPFVPVPRLPRESHDPVTGARRGPLMPVCLTLDLRAASPAYEQLRAQLGGHIRAGTLAPAPSCRSCGRWPVTWGWP